MRVALAIASAAAAAMLVVGRRVRVPAINVGAAVIGAGAGGILVTTGVDMAPALVASGLVVVTPGLLAGARRRRIAAETRRRWPDFLAIVRARIGAGEPLPDAVRAAALSLGGAFADLDRAWGSRFAIELEAVRARWADPIADRVLTTIRVAAETGGAHVDAVLSSLSGSLSDDLRMRAAHDAALTQQRLTAGVALVAPWAILALSLATNPQAAEEFAGTTGRVILIGGALTTMTGYVLARRASRLSQPPRVFD